ncbi:unnamed protein product [Nippostrongylus brasiliensis]|uniref:Secreted protein n=1 Tax=Nippostrongylus brasiliensis TaxID=27835 RepID=A0A0N4Y9T9_NIPBR|nr:unnamed protein product [Nippostrongylus brasiliensis]
MISSRLVFLVALLTITEATVDECVHQNEEFCTLINDVRDLLQYLEFLDGNIYANGRAAVILADDLVAAVLRAEKRQLIPKLREALEAELNAFVNVRTECLSVLRDKNGQCSIYSFDFLYMTAELIRAIIEVHPRPKKKEAIADDCTHENKEFCYLLEDIHETNNDCLKLMDGELEKNGKKALAYADKLVVAAMKTEEQELIAALKKALKAELSAYVQVKADCSRLGSNYSEICEELFFEVAFAITELIQVTVEVQPDSQKKADVETIFSELDRFMTGNPVSGFENEAYAVGTQVTTAFRRRKVSEAQQMFNSRLIFLVTMLTISEAVADECTHENDGFCYLIDDALETNKNCLELMEEDLEGDGKRALALADKMIVAVLNATGEHLITALKKALQAELSAFVQVKADCFKLDRGDNRYNEKCEDLFFEIGYVAVELIQATIKVHPDSRKKEKIEKIFSQLGDTVPGFENEAHSVGKQILKIM